MGGLLVVVVVAVVVFLEGDEDADDLAEDADLGLGGRRVPATTVRA